MDHTSSTTHLDQTLSESLSHSKAYSHAILSSSRNNIFSDQSIDRISESEKVMTAAHAPGATHNNAQVQFSGDPSSAKRRKLTSEERLLRNRERNRVHAKKTRERKRTQSKSVQQRINELFEVGRQLRQLVDERYTASSLLGLRQCSDLSTTTSVPIVSSQAVCENFYEKTLKENNWVRDEQSGQLTSSDGQQLSKRMRRQGKYSAEEREIMRRERNRMHAKKTRDKKKQFSEMSEKIISEMESEIAQLRRYLQSLNVDPDEYLTTVLKFSTTSQAISSDSLPLSRGLIDPSRRVSNQSVNNASADDDDDDDDDDIQSANEEDDEEDEVTEYESDGTVNESAADNVGKMLGEEEKEVEVEEEQLSGKTDRSHF